MWRGHYGLLVECISDALFCCVLTGLVRSTSYSLASCVTGRVKAPASHLSSSSIFSLCAS